VPEREVVLGGEGLARSMDCHGVDMVLAAGIRQQTVDSIRTVDSRWGLNSVHRTLPCVMVTVCTELASLCASPGDTYCYTVVTLLSNCINSYRQVDEQTERQIGRQIGRQVDKQKSRQTGRRADRQKGRKVDRETGRQADRQTGRQICGQACKQTCSYRRSV
jgi:hypothetical protein